MISSNAVERIYHEEVIKGLTNVLGSFLGECIRRNYGGKWTQFDGQWAVAFNERNAAFPFNKLGKQFQNGHEGGDSIISFYTGVPAVFKLNPPPK